MVTTVSQKQEKFLYLIVEGEKIVDAYIKVFHPNFEKTEKVARAAHTFFQRPKLQTRYFEIKEVVEKELKERAVWTREQAINELKDLVYANKKELMRYEKAYNDELEMIEEKIAEQEEAVKKARSKKKRNEAAEQLVKCKLARIEINQRHQSNKAVNEAILNGVERLNSLMGIDKDETQKIEAAITFVDDMTVEEVKK